MTGAERFKRSVRRFVGPAAAGEMPKPDDQWGVWVKYRLKRLEDSQRWMLRVILGALVAQFALEVVKLL